MSVAKSGYKIKDSPKTVSVHYDNTPTTPGSVSGVTLDKTTLSLSVGASEHLTATVAPSNATNKNVTWSSSNNSVATVSNGTVTGHSVGSATITVTTVDGNKTATCDVTVTGAAVVVPSGTFEVKNVADLKRVGTDTDGWTLSASYMQTADIDLTSVNWTAIGTSTKPFTGSYDGGGHTISNLTINATGIDFQGFFGFTNGAIVKNVGLANCDIKGKNKVGGVIGYMKNGGTVQNCYVTGSVSGGASGGVVGQMEDGGTVQNCYAACDVSGIADISLNTDVACVGGVVGQNAPGSTVQNCYATGTVSGKGKNVGGVVGVNNADGTVQNCYATGIVSATDLNSSVIGSFVGGVVGVDISANTTLRNCIALNPNIIGTSLIGRVVGNYNTQTNNYGRSDMKKNNGSGGWTSSASGIDGASITSADWNMSTWWIGVAKFDPEVWDFTKSLPTLKNMPAGTQNPVIQ